ncbi:MAG: DUF2264 domain-containing protein [Verrucomicrobiales bacterium]|jgi:hypothetical protein|nr:DUF2264 domain-containing protein [Verrucomicrobiales bacterium]
MPNNRQDVQQLARELVEPLTYRFSPGGARVRLGFTGAAFSVVAEELEGFCRPLWGISPLAAGGGEFAHWELYRQGLANGSNPQHSEFWGNAANRDQRLVEMAAIGLTLLLAPEHTYHALPGKSQSQLADWLNQINAVETPDNNWLFFRVLVNLGLQHVGAPCNQKATHQALNRLEEFYLGDGWYFDGENAGRDYYIPFAFHFYGLIYARHAEQSDPDRAQRFKERAKKFAGEFIHLFDANGGAIPYGRSLTYRFAMGAFWGALAYANVEAFDWGILKGLYLRHLRWWQRQPIRDGEGLLTIGYGYPNLLMAESYNSPSSPYWAMKAFLPLALPETHPFWQSEEQPLPKLAATKILKQPGFVICHDAEQTHAVALNHGGNQRVNSWVRNAEAKYAKFVYSSHFAFSVTSDARGLSGGAFDSMLALSDNGRHFRVRGDTLTAAFFGEILYSKWQPWDDVSVETWLLAAMPWHIRIHRIHAGRKLFSAENGFAVDRGTDDGPLLAGQRKHGDGYALAIYPGGTCGILDLNGKRSGRVDNAEANTNLLYPRTLIPSLQAEHNAGEYWLCSAILGLVSAENAEKFWRNPPQLPDLKKLELLRPNHAI